MDARAIMAKIRRGQDPSAEELSWFTNGLATREVSDAQAGAFAMAVCLNGLSDEGRVALTTGMRDSGDVMKWDLPGPVLDKHSTGGVGDPVSLILAPALAACDVFVPMVSGRGLGHTGGTLDKLEAIPGLSTAQTTANMRKITRDIGCAIVSATNSIAPAGIGRKSRKRRVYEDTARGRDTGPRTGFHGKRRWHAHGCVHHGYVPAPRAKPWKRA